MRKSTKAVLAAFALTAGALVGLSAPAAAGLPPPAGCDRYEWCVPLDHVKERPGENMHWGNKPMG
ncbi:hypothetical protein [Herbidospora mongoliensis]|uniref:hypothetical protein n=1 Tax=Herbidospora mongoliensis TaxID=688067 RepID=UPI00082AF1D1|nr:hypothetical protein [Herbidospora mongoliensis]